MRKKLHPVSFSKPCLWCGAEFWSWRGQCEGLYCSQTCKRLANEFVRGLRSHGFSVGVPSRTGWARGNLRGLLERLLK